MLNVWWRTSPLTMAEDSESEDVDADTDPDKGSHIDNATFHCMNHVLSVPLSDG